MIVTILIAIANARHDLIMSFLSCMGQYVTTVQSSWDLGLKTHLLTTLYNRCLFYNTKMIYN